MPSLKTTCHCNVTHCVDRLEVHRIGTLGSEEKTIGTWSSPDWGGAALVCKCRKYKQLRTRPHKTLIMLGLFTTEATIKIKHLRREELTLMEKHSRKGFCRNPRGIFLKKVPSDFFGGFFGGFFGAFFLGKKQEKESTHKSTAIFKSKFGSFGAKIHTARIRP